MTEIAGPSGEPVVSGGGVLNIGAEATEYWWIWEATRSGRIDFPSEAVESGAIPWGPFVRYRRRIHWPLLALEYVILAIATVVGVKALRWRARRVRGAHPTEFGPHRY